ncbi:MAG: hypothetical protein ACLVJO_08550 [[Clostridium] scindens]
MVWLPDRPWHGAAWNFVFWGLYYGILLLIEKYFLAISWSNFQERWNISTALFW